MAAGHPSPYAHPAGSLRQRQRPRTSGRPNGKGNRPSHSTQPQATATDPPAYQTQWRAKAHSRQGNPPHTESNGSAVCLNNRATPSADRALTGRAAGTPQGSEAASDAQSPASIRSAGSQRSSATPNPEYPAKVLTRGGGGIIKSPFQQFSQESESDAQRSRLRTHRQTAIDPPGQRRRHRLSSKGGGQGNKVSEGHNRKKAKKANLWERNAHVGLGQPRTRHHAQSGRSGHPSVTVPLA
ncbi:hypothetical protein WOLCODRAFT_159492 [Wolfiporia cocos MD-104 SS10]|uniref:Uncharacterized protein n=1 Tax=Wolfiporia cocos (strain MD-104) TaxID=742152 RepID=A0A2H3JCS3_WOLCO|nr:hypothetical protein WOLCODRAFT_159492 [Wolfiporia cocos MD-104 SS10]